MSEYQDQIDNIKNVKARLAANGLKQIEKEEKDAAERARARREKERADKHRWQKQEDAIDEWLKTDAPAPIDEDGEPIVDAEPVITVRQIQKEVCARRKLPLWVMESARKSTAFANARFEAMWIASILTKKSLPEIGGYFGGRDHTTVLHAIGRYTEMLESGEAEYPPGWDHSKSGDRGMSAQRKKQRAESRELLANFREAYARAHNGFVINIRNSGHGFYVVRRNGRRIIRGKKERILELTAEYNSREGAAT